MNHKKKKTMNELLPSNGVSKNHPKPSVILFNGYGLTLYKSGAGADSRYFVASNVSIAAGIPDVTAKGRLSKANLIIVHSTVGLVALFYATLMFLVTLLISFMVTGAIEGAFHPLLLLIEGAIALLLAGVFGGRSIPHHFKMTRESVATAQLRREISSGNSGITVTELSLPITEIIGKVLKIDIVDKPILINALVRKIESGATDQEKYDWGRGVINIFNLQPDLPAHYIPILNPDVEILEQEIYVKAESEIEEKRLLALEEKVIADEVTKEHEEIDSEVSLTGALTFLGIDEVSAKDRQTSRKAKAAELAALPVPQLAAPAPANDDVRFAEATKMLAEILATSHHDKKLISHLAIPGTVEDNER